MVEVVALVCSIAALVLSLLAEAAHDRMDQLVRDQDELRVTQEMMMGRLAELWEMHDDWIDDPENEPTGGWLQ